jgi:hypothetical protein
MYLKACCKFIERLLHVLMRPKDFRGEGGLTPDLRICVFGHVWSKTTSDRFLLDIFDICFLVELNPKNLKR